MSDITFRVDANCDSHSKTTVKTRSFTMTIDEPENMGGTDQGANPVEYVLAALSGCLNVVGHLIAQEMDIAIKCMSIAIEGDLDPAKFMGKSEEGRAGYKEVRAIIDADIDADDKTKDAWLAAVEERCPVSDIIAHATPVHIKLK